MLSHHDDGSTDIKPEGYQEPDWSKMLKPSVVSEQYCEFTTKEIAPWLSACYTDTGCGHKNYGPETKLWLFCPFCGKPIKRINL